MSKRKIVLGNWKTNKTLAEVRAFFTAINAEKSLPKDVAYGVAPVFVHLPLALELKAGETIIAAQDCNAKASGAYTGSVSHAQLKDLGVTHVLVGHSERRTIYHETDVDANEKVTALLNAGLTPVLCVGESLKEYDAQQTKQVCARQVKGALVGVAPEAAGKLIVAYEPVWAIGTGRTAKQADVVAPIEAIRAAVSDCLGKKAGQSVPVLYGGSVKPDNAKDIMSWPGVDGILVGGASLKPDDFLALVRAGAGA